MSRLGDRIIGAWMKSPGGKKLKAQLSRMPETDSNFFPNGMSRSYLDRFVYDRATILSECLRAWRVNPTARRVAKLYTQFIVGEGIAVKAEHKATQKFVSAWWHDELNAMDEQVPDWMDELTRTGDLFILFSVDEFTGMSYVRAIPAETIKDIETAGKDVRQELAYIPNDLNTPAWPAYNRDISQRAFVIHYAVNRPVGCKFGEPDLAPILPWVSRYSAWLEDRARLNKFRQAFMYVVTGKYEDKAEQAARQNELNSNPPPSGAILVAKENETWSILAPELSSFEAGEDGLALKKMIAVGAGIPIHYLSEPESSTRTTAEAAGTPTFRGLEQMQTGFLRMLTRLARMAVRIRKQARPQEHLNPEGVEVVGPDITERDNAVLALAVSRIYPAVSDLFDREGIDEAEYLRLVYRMAGESFGEDARAPKMIRKGLGEKGKGAGERGKGRPMDPAKRPSTKPDESGQE